ncbi:hypothetical protein [Labrenzia sp. 011]|uniref:hypothetical protein n=1 Tax=Labrenzia sp. 011 TaxID=2171494 RepID=UPI0010570780|nr:hypothetical protein [Labrenzia sp. 011]
MPQTAESGGDGLSDQQIRRALARTLKSPEFQSAPQLRAFLRFVGTATLKNDRNTLKGYTIAVEALGRPEEFNPITDPIVRVEAARLRRRLEKYYAGSGSRDPVRIVIPKGSYAPEFRSLQSRGQAVSPDAADRAPPDPDPPRPGPPDLAAPGRKAEGRLASAMALRVPLPGVLAIAAACLLAGYLARAL